MSLNNHSELRSQTHEFVPSKTIRRIEEQRGNDLKTIEFSIVEYCAEEIFSLKMRPLCNRLSLNEINEHRRQLKRMFNDQNEFNRSNQLK